MRFDLSTDLKNLRLDQIRAAVDGGATEGEVWLYGGTPPLTCAATVLPVQCVITLPRPCASVAAGVLTFPRNLEGLRVDAEPLTWGRLVDGNGKAWADFDVSVLAGTGALRLNAITGAIGSSVKILTGELSE